MAESDEEILNGDSVDDRVFWHLFLNDARQGVGRLVLVAPFLGMNRIRFLTPTIVELINRGISICVFIQKPDTTTDYFMRCLRELQYMGVHVTIRSDIHVKVALIDDIILWDGSLNILSHNRTIDQMRRWTDARQIRRAISQHRLDRCAQCYENYPQYRIGNHENVSRFVDTKNIITAVTRRRAELNITQCQVAKSLGWTQARVSDIESGNRDARLSTYMQLARMLGLEVIAVPRILVPSIARLLARLKKRNEQWDPNASKQLPPKKGDRQ